MTLEDLSERTQAIFHDGIQDRDRTSSPSEGNTLPYESCEDDFLDTSGEAEYLQSLEDMKASIESVTATLTPEIDDAFSACQVLSSEMKELFKQLRKATQTLSFAFMQREHVDAVHFDFLEALVMELQLRVSERDTTVQILSQIDQEKTNCINDLKSSFEDLFESYKRLRIALRSSQGRLEGSWSDSSNNSDANPFSVYDWVVDVSLLSDLGRKGWEVSFSREFYDKLDSEDKSALIHSDDHMWEGAVVSVVGLYDKGKTFVLNKITQSNLPSGKKVSTKGLSFKHVKVEGETNFVLLDSAGSYSPVKVVDELSVAEKEATEWFLLDLVFELSDYFVCVVNDFTSLDQRYLDRLTRSLQNSSKSFREVIVVHNLKDVTSTSVFHHIWKSQVTGIYQGGQDLCTKVAAINPSTGSLEERNVKWFKTKFSRHVALANEDSSLGKALNPWTISLLRYWLKSVFVPVDRKMSVVRNVVEFSNKKLSAYFNESLKLSLHAGSGPYTKYIRPLSGSGTFRLPQISLDASGLLTRPDSFIPEVDIVLKGNEYIIFMDVPGLTAKDITVSRQNVVTIIKGSRSLPYLESENALIEKRERKYGDFTMTFKIPHAYQRKWTCIAVDEGVLCIKFIKDNDEDDIVCTDLINS